jgi:hypothetical protein
MTLLSLFAVLLLLGAGVWVARVALPDRMEPIRTLIVVTLVAIAVIVVLQALGLLAALNRPTPHV